MFSLVEAVLLRPLPFPSPDRLVRIWETKTGESGSRAGVSPPDFFDWRERSTSFTEMVLFGGDQVLAVIEAPSGSIQVADVDVTTNIFSVLGIAPLVGPGFSVEPGAPRAIVLSERLWRAAFDADPAVVGRIVRVEVGLALPVAGVIRDGAGFPPHVDVWISAPDALLPVLPCCLHLKRR